MITFWYVPNHVEQFLQFMSIFRHTLVILMAPSKVPAKLHPVIDRETIIEQFIVKLGECPMFFIIGNVLSIIVVGLAGEIV